MSLMNPPAAEEVLDRLSRGLPDGLRLLDIRPVGPGQGKLRPNGARYRLRADDDLFIRRIYEEKISAPSLPMEKKSKKGFRTVNLLEHLGPVNILTTQEIEITLYGGPGGIVRPAAAAEVLFDLQPGTLGNAQTEKLETIWHEE